MIWLQSVKKKSRIFDNAAYNIDLLCSKSGRKFKTLTDKLIYMAQTLPEEFSEDTPYAIHSKLKGRKS